MNVDRAYTLPLKFSHSQMGHMNRWLCDRKRGGIIGGALGIVDGPNCALGYVLILVSFGGNHHFILIGTGLRVVTMGEREKG